MNVVVKFLVVSAHFCPKKRPRLEYLKIFFLQIRPLATVFFMENCKPTEPQTGPRDHGFCGSFCSLQFTFERRHEVAFFIRLRCVSWSFEFE